jgi:N-dimethylarginine dimethylaminohydrolase
MNMEQPAKQPSVPACDLTPTQMSQPAFLMSAPFCFSADQPNNVWMDELDELERQIDRPRAMKQFLALYGFVASEALVYLLPSPSDCGLQDLVFTANLGIVVEHLPAKDTVIISNFTSEPRLGESELGRRFFAAMGYDVHVSPFKFEGEAELKHLYDNVYIGGFGIRSEQQTYAWMERTFGMKVIPVEMRDAYLYHLDCSVFPIDRENTLICTEMFSREELTELGRYTNIIDVPFDEASMGICNSARLANTIMNASNIFDLQRGTEDYQLELAKNRRLEDIAASLGFEISFFNLSEYLKGGALLSCMLMHLNRKSYDFKLI